MKIFYVIPKSVTIFFQFCLINQWKMLFYKFLHLIYLNIILFSLKVKGRRCYSWQKHTKDLKVKDVISIADTVVETIDKFYVEKSSLLSILRSSTTEPTYHRQSEILNRILSSTGTDLTYTLHEPSHINQTNDKYLRVFNLFFVDNFDGYK